MKPNRVVQEWIDKANQDYATCELLLTQPYQNREAFLEIIYYHLQQALEKLFKARLIGFRQSVPKTHDLVELANRLKPFISGWDPDFSALDDLTTAGVASRYPGIEITEEDVLVAFSLCTKLREQLLLFLE